MKELSKKMVVGSITDVQGSTLTAALTDDEQGRTPVVTIGDEDVLVGQLGSYVGVKQGDVNLIAIVSRITEHELLSPVALETASHEAVKLPYARRVVQLTPIGTIGKDGLFERGVGVYPTTGAEVHVIGCKEISKMFERFQEKDFSVGQLATHPTQNVFLDPSNLYGRHFAILGQTGAGKSWTVASLIQKTTKVMPRAHIIILDLHGEYCWNHDDGERHYAFDDSVVRHVDARELEIPYWLMTYAELCDLLIDQTDYSAHNQVAAFRDVLNELRVAEGAKLGLSRTTLDTPVFFDLLELRSRIEKLNGPIPAAAAGKTKSGPLTGKFDNFLMRLDSKLNDVRYDFLLKPQVRADSDSLSSLLRDFVGLGNPKRAVTVIDLSSVPFDVRPTVAAQIGRLAFEFNYWNPEYRKFPITLLCEEAHAYIPRDSQNQFQGSRRSMERIAKEGRKYGVGLAIVSQRPHEVSETVLAQCGTFICLRITNPSDQSYVRGLVPESEGDLVSVLAGLGRGEALILGEAVPLPTRVKFFPPNPTPNSDDIDFFGCWRDGPEDLNTDLIVERWRNQER